MVGGLGEDLAQYSTGRKEVGSAAFRLHSTEISHQQAVALLIAQEESEIPTLGAAVQKTNLLAMNMTKVVNHPRVLTRALKASTRRAREGVQAGERDGVGDEAFNLPRRPGSSENTVRKVVCSGWYWGLHSTSVVQMCHYTVEARKELSICLASHSSARWFSGSSR